MSDAPTQPSGPAVGPSAHALSRYTAARKTERKGIALCLSGGGFRAALFHLGALRRLGELGILSKVEVIASVSGGSILAAHLAARLRPWPAAGSVPADWTQTVETPFHAFVRHDLRTGAVLKRLLPWNWLRSSTGVTTLMQRYYHRLTDLKLTDLPERPRFVLCATDMAFGVNWVSERDRVGDYQAGYVEPPPPAWTVARAVAASSCFPPVFNPLPVGLDARRFQGGRAAGTPEWNDAVSDLRLTDGGVYDNLGLEPVWKSAATVLVSDGGGTFDVESDRGLLSRLGRYTTIIQEQVGALRKRWLISNFISGEFSGTYWGIGSAVANYEVPGLARYSEALVHDVIAEVRTDLDAFSDAEIAVLGNHGYLLAAAAIARHQPALPSPTPAAPIAVPWPEWLDEDRVRRALKDSSKRKILGRG
jgi:NTE family protein